MREILGERRKNRRKNGTRAGRLRALREAALEYARHWRWPVLPGAEASPEGRCACGRAGCPVPGAHPLDPGLLAATTDERMIRWWWTSRPHAPIVLATGGQAPCALAVPAAAGRAALAELDRRGVRTGPVIAAPGRWLLLVRPYELPQLGDLLGAMEHVPGSLRFHGPGGYLPLPPSGFAAEDAAGWVRRPRPAPRGGGAELPCAADLLAVLVDEALRDPGGLPGR
ncbi:bifunctional DNA primase/polymerase [Streptomyces sp. DSM 44917]|uniref:Bifunctional DNA primase/polymerase n=1 Tax=Streptomyces boetiae TaxID=3075541 RepID=A0ABU2LE14_9ACTN|nr:bifunctional DNA primase/polymerase [Streptomyces sp. DSM 44917]MDT0309842.1 bifunctional DNA primase/polymerase [Streptomyces sp. DSM 44917]